MALNTVLGRALHSPEENDSSSVSPSVVSRRSIVTKPRSHSVRKKASGGSGLGGYHLKLVVDKGVMTVTKKVISTGAQTEAKRMANEIVVRIDEEAQTVPEAVTALSNNTSVCAMSPLAENERGMRGLVTAVDHTKSRHKAGRDGETLREAHRVGRGPVCGLRVRESRRFASPKPRSGAARDRRGGGLLPHGQRLLHPVSSSLLRPAGLTTSLAESLAPSSLSGTGTGAPSQKPEENQQRPRPELGEITRPRKIDDHSSRSKDGPISVAAGGREAPRERNVAGDIQRACQAEGAGALAQTAAQDRHRRTCKERDHPGTISSQECV